MTAAKTIAQTARKIAKRLFDRRIISAYGPSDIGQRKNDPHQTLESLERWSARATLLILFGILFEIFLLFWFPHDKWERLWSAVADVFIGFGLVVEYIVILRAIVASGDADRQSNEKIFEAKQRAAKAELATAEAKLETERLKKEVAWRTLDPDTAGRLVAELSRRPSRVILVFISADPEATAYCAQFVDVFRRAGWKYEVVGRTFHGPPIGIFVAHGVSWSAAIQVEIDSLRDALIRAGITVDKSAGAVEATELKFRDATADVKVIIGHKPAPQIG
jgi:hypothetical protein